MPTIPKLKPFDPIEYLVFRKFPMVNWRERYAPQGGVRVHQRASTKADDPVFGTQKELQDYEASLKAMSPEQIELLLAEERKKETAERLFAAQKEEAGRFYNLPEAKANYVYWAAQSYWTVEEAVALSFGKNPKVVTWERLQPCTKIWPFAKEFEDRFDQFNRAVWAKQIWSHTYPNLILAWAGRMRIAMPPRLVAEVEALGLQIADWKTLYDQRVEEVLRLRGELAAANAANTNAPSAAAEASPKPAAEALSEKGRGTFQKMILGMALEQYGYDPNDGKSPVPKAIATDLALHGIELTEKTIRNLLRAAAERFPKGER